LAKASLQRGLEAIRFNTEQVGPRFNRFLDGRIDRASAAGQAYMRTRAPWRDNTGNRKDRVPGAARAGLHTEAQKAPLTFDHTQKRIVFAHTVLYGIFLETKDNGKFSIIMPSVKVIAEYLMASLEESLSALGHET
jgi:hypothetical protein